MVHLPRQQQKVTQQEQIRNSSLTPPRSSKVAELWNDDHHWHAGDATTAKRPSKSAGSRSGPQMVNAGKFRQNLKPGVSHGLPSSQARGYTQVQCSHKHVRDPPVSAEFDGADLSRCQKAFAELLGRRKDEIAVRLSTMPYTAKRIAAARKRRIQAELKDIKEQLATVKQKTNALQAI